MEWIFVTLASLLAGFVDAIVGGGGLVMVPVLTMLFAAQAEFPINEVLHLALGTSIATILFTSLASLRAHHQHDAVLWKIVLQITPGILAHTFIKGSIL